MHTSSRVKEIRQCSCPQCRKTRSLSKSTSKWKRVRAAYRKMFLEMVKGADLEDYNKNLATRDYDADRKSVV